MDHEPRVWLGFMDIETTGPDPATCEIRQIGLTPFDLKTFDFTGGEFGEFQITVANKRPQDEAAFNIHGIPDGEGVPLYEALAEMEYFLRTHWKVPFDARRDQLVRLGGHNIAVFDQPVLRAAMGGERYSKWFHYRVRDSAIFARGLIDVGILPSHLENAKLAELCAHFGLEGGGAHKALTDARDEGYLYRDLVRTVRSRRRV